MKKIGLLSDTHGYIDQRIFEYFKDCDEIWHAGDIGNIATADAISSVKPFRAVHGNIDGQDVRIVYPEILRFFCEQVDVMIKHIGGYPGNYDRSVKEILSVHPPKLFITGHSHILKAGFDKKNNVLHLNPGAAGKNGLHKVRTVMRFLIDKSDIKELEVIELGSR
jgi:uncharacterized protein